MINKIKVIKVEDDRFYWIDGIYYPSVTTILAAYPTNSQFVKWVGQNGYQESQRIKTLAAEKGSLVHSRIEMLLDGHTLNYMDHEEDEWDYLRAFVEFWTKYKPETIEFEHTIHSVLHGYAGTLDWYGWLTLPATKSTEELRVKARIDWKTSNHLWPKYDLQLAAYEMAEREIGKPAADKLYIVQLGTKTKSGYSLHEVKDLQDKFDRFKNIYTVWKDLNPNAKPFQKEVPAELSLEFNINKDDRTPSSTTKT